MDHIFWKCEACGKKYRTVRGSCPECVVQPTTGLGIGQAMAAMNDNKVVELASNPGRRYRINIDDGTLESRHYGDHVEECYRAWFKEGGLLACELLATDWRIVPEVTT